ncbi:MAG: sporulation initiation factor Spo0A C-terminal domain-containing protein [Fusicatenibacter sp.]|nr:sporulation initiation factor Spo0A C-terminal domain-containing protein [Fusicatenibacter sp.]
MNEIQRLLHSLGIGANYRGYKYLVLAISLCLEDEDQLLRISKTLYPKIARTYHVSTSCVERNIRTAINVCWEHGNRELLLHISMYPLEIKPTNSEFLDIVTSYLKCRSTFS